MSPVRDQRGRFAARVVPSQPILIVGMSRIDGSYTLTREVLPARRGPTPLTDPRDRIWLIGTWLCVIATCLVLAHSHGMI